MNRRTWTLAVMTLCAFLFLAPPALADGIIIIDPPLPDWEPAYLAVKYHHVTVAIENQVATTHVDQVFVNDSPHQLEGTYVFPLPAEAAINDFAMWVDGARLPGEMLPADEARRIYEDIVRRRRDPALLEYVGRNTFRASIFPIEPGAEKRVEIEYTQVLPVDNGLVSYRYPLDTERFSPKPIPDVWVRVEIRSKEAIKAIYSPSHDVDIDRRGDFEARVGYEETNVRPDTDWELYYSVAQEDVGLNLLSYRSPGEKEGFFLMLLAPRVEVEQVEVIEKDVLLVLDTSGSMRGEKMDQAKRALSFVLDRLNEGDRFNVIAFSTGVRQFTRDLSDTSQRQEALRWVDELEAKGGTNIDRALQETLLQVDDRAPDRPAIVIFVTDGLATEGVTDTEQILADVQENASGAVRIFCFGVGDDVNTILLDRMARDHRGTSAYVRPGQSIEEEVSSFYAKVSTPLLADVRVDFGDVTVEDTYPYPLPDLFAGSQVVMVGRYRDGGETTVTLSGEVNGVERAFSFDRAWFETASSGEGSRYAFIPRLWATRKVGYLLNEIRLHGESKELVQEIVDLAVRYGIMTPYTSFLVNEDNDVFSERGRQETAQRELSSMETAEPAEPSGKVAVDDAQRKAELEGSTTATGATGAEVKIVRDKTFLLRDGVWIDTSYDADRMTPLQVGFMSDDYFGLIAARPEWGAYFGIGEQVLVVLEGQAYQVVQEGAGQEIAIPTPKPAATPVAQATVAAGSTPTAAAQATPTAGATHTPSSGRGGALACPGTAGAALLALLAALVFSRRGSNRSRTEGMN